MIKKLGIFGGSFEPFHNEHLAICKSAMDELGLDELLVMPVHLAPHKKGHIITDDKVRQDIIRYSLVGLNNVYLSDYEIQKGGTSYTYQTAEHFSKTAEQLYFIVGADMLADFKTWKNPQKILDNAKLAVFLRDGFDVDISAEHEYFKKNFHTDFTLLSYIGRELSATRIRIFSMLKIDITHLVEPKAATYIAENKVFDGGKYAEFVINNEKPERIRHTAGVIECALKKTAELGLDEQKVITAAMLHDCAKYLDKTNYPEYVSPKGISPAVEHAYLGAYVAEKVLGITDEEILNAIRFHTSGTENMTALEKLIFTADMVEDGRTYKGVKILRAMYEEDFESCFIECVKEEMQHLKAHLTEEEIFFETKRCFDYYCKK